MKKLLLLIFCIGPFFANAQECDAVITNLDCDGSDISFNLTLTADGTPVALSGTNFLAIGTLNDNDPYGSDVIVSKSVTGNSDDKPEIDDFSFSPDFQNANDCDDFTGQLYLKISGNNNTNAGQACSTLPVPIRFEERSSEPLPTFGQWSLILFGMGVLSMALFLVVRNGREISI